MDNASKALIMAGAILIAVALVGVGVYLYQSAAGTVGTGVDQLEAASMETKNSAIEQYEGTIRGSDLKQLIRRVNAYNARDVFPNGLTLSGITDASGVKNSKLYKVTLGYEEGYVKTINVAASTTTTTTTTTK